jgi:hypothetical protein
MHTAIDSLKLATLEACVRGMGADQATTEFCYDYVLFYVAKLMEGTTSEKQTARAELKKLIGRGRHLLRIAENAAREKTAATPGPINSKCECEGLQPRPDYCPICDSGTFPQTATQPTLTGCYTCGIKDDWKGQPVCPHCGNQPGGCEP